MAAGVVFILPVVWALLVGAWNLIAWCHERAGRPFPGHLLTRSRWGVRLGKAVVPVWFAGIFVVPLGTGWAFEQADRARARRACEANMVTSDGRITDGMVDRCVASHYGEDDD